jgi:hypothetical protein
LRQDLARIGAAVGIVAVLWVSLGAIQKDAVAMMHARGAFDVTIAPVTTDPVLGRMSLAKVLHGDLEGTSVGEMLTAGTPVKDSGAYVAVERVTGTLQGRRGTFILQHSGTMTRGAQQLTITVVPDSGTDQLAGIAGSMKIIIDKDGKHFYDFEYTLDRVP